MNPAKTNHDSPPVASHSSSSSNSIEQGSWIVEYGRLVRGQEAIKRGDNNVWITGEYLMEGKDFYTERSTKGYEVAFPLLTEAP